MTQVDSYPVDHWPNDQFHPVYDSFREWLDESAPEHDRRLRSRRPPNRTTPPSRNRA